MFNKWNSRHVLIGIAVLIGLFLLRWKGITEAELPLWYNALQWCVGIITFGHAANKLVDNKSNN